MVTPLLGVHRQRDSSLCLSHRSPSARDEARASLEIKIDSNNQFPGNEFFLFHRNLDASRNDFSAKSLDCDQVSDEQPNV